MFAAFLRTRSLRAVLLVGVCLMSLGMHATAANEKAAYDEVEVSSLVQSQIVVRSGVRKVKPLEDGEDLEDDEDAFAGDDDNPSLMQAGVCTTRSKPKLQPLDDEEINDELSMMQIDLPINRAQSGESEAYGIEEEEEEFSAMQTSVTVLPRKGEEDDFDGASFMQEKATFIKKSERSDSDCANGQVDEAYDVDETDEVSLMQTDVVLTPGQSEDGEDYGIEEDEDEFSAMQTSVTVLPRKGEEDDFDGASFMQEQATFIKKSERSDSNCANRQVDEAYDHDETDEVSLMQTDVVLTPGQSEDGGDYGIEEEDDEFSAMQTSLTVMPRKGEQDDFDGASFMQEKATFIQKSERSDTSCATGQVNAEEESDVMSL